MIKDITTQASFHSDTGIVHIIPRKWPLLQHAMQCDVIPRQVAVYLHNNALCLHYFCTLQLPKNKSLKSLSCNEVFNVWGLTFSPTNIYTTIFFVQEKRKLKNISCILPMSIVDLLILQNKQKSRPN